MTHGVQIKKGGSVVRNGTFLTVAVAFLLCGTMATANAGELGFHGIGGRAGLVSPDGFDMTFGLGGHADLGPIIPMLHLYPCVEFWSSDNFTEFSLNADVRYYFPMTGVSFSPYVGGGLCIIYWTWDYHMQGFGDLSANDTEFGFEFLGGLDFPVAFGTVFVEAKYKMDGADVFKVCGGFTIPMGG
jgi:hypothetical protein